MLDDFESDWTLRPWIAVWFSTNRCGMVFGPFQMNRAERDPAETMKTYFRMGLMSLIGILMGLLANAFAPEPLPLLAPEEQFEMDLDEGIQVASSEILDLWVSGEAMFIDARGEEAYSEGRIPGAFSLPYKGFDNGAVPETVDYLPRDQLLVIYCDGADCHASQVVYDRLLELGFSRDRMKIFHGGWNEWKETGGEVESDNG